MSTLPSLIRTLEDSVPPKMDEFSEKFWMAFNPPHPHPPPSEFLKKKFGEQECLTSSSTEFRMCEYWRNRMKPYENMVKKIRISWEWWALLNSIAYLHENLATLFKKIFSRLRILFQRLPKIVLNIGSVTRRYRSDVRYWVSDLLTDC